MSSQPVGSCRAPTFTRPVNDTRGVTGKFHGSKEHVTCPRSGEWPCSSRGAPSHSKLDPKPVSNWAGVSWRAREPVGRVTWDDFQSAESGRHRVELAPYCNAEPSLASLGCPYLRDTRKRHPVAARRADVLYDATFFMLGRELDNEMTCLFPCRRICGLSPWR